MNDRLIAALVSPLLLTATPVFAQANLQKVRAQTARAAETPPVQVEEETPSESVQPDEDAPATSLEDGEEKPATEIEGQKVQTGQVKVRAPNAREEAPGETHTVVKGDTLWDLSQKYLGSPWYWPKVWSYNPQIANPHWIYPGNEVRFFTAGEEVPTRVEAGGADGDNGGVIAAQSLQGEDAVSMSVLEGEDNQVHVSGKISYQTKTGIRYLHAGFVAKEELESSGVIEGSFTPSEMLSVPDLAYVRFKKRDQVKTGDRYLVFHKERLVEHPITHDDVGYLTRLLGVVKVEGVSQGSVVRTRIVESWGEISRGDLIGPFGEEVRAIVSQKPNEKEIKGHLISALTEDRDLLGEHNLVIIDKGRSDGVAVGNTFSFIRQGDPLSDPLDSTANQDPDYPVEDVGTCLAMDVKSTTTVCLMMRSMRELAPGDRAVMVPSSFKVGVSSK